MWFCAQSQSDSLLIETILISSSPVVPVLVSVCIWSGAPCLRHHMVCFLSRSQVKTRAFFYTVELGDRIFTLLSPPAWYSPSSHYITSTRYRPPSIRQLFLRQHQPRPPPKAKRRTDVSSCIRQPIKSRCWWAAHQSRRIFVMSFYRIWKMLYRYIFYPDLQFDSCRNCPHSTDKLSALFKWLLRDSDVSCYLKSPQPVVFFFFLLCLFV